MIDIPKLNSFIIIKDNKLNIIKNLIIRVTITKFYRYSTIILDYIKSKNIDSGFNYLAINN